VEIIKKAEELITEPSFEPSSESVLYLTDYSGMTAYDCEFVAVAQTLEIPLLTYDRRLVKAFPQTALPVARWLAG